MSDCVNGSVDTGVITTVKPALLAGMSMEYDRVHRRVDTMIVPEILQTMECSEYNS